MNKAHREGEGKMPVAPKVDSPFNATPQGGFAPEKGGNLRDHNGCYASDAIRATTHYDGDYGSSSSTPQQRAAAQAPTNKRGGSSGNSGDKVAGAGMASGGANRNPNSGSDYGSARGGGGADSGSVRGDSTGGGAVSSLSSGIRNLVAKARGTKGRRSR